MWCILLIVLYQNGRIGKKWRGFAICSPCIRFLISVSAVRSVLLVLICIGIETQGGDCIRHDFSEISLGKKIFLQTRILFTWSCDINLCQ